MPSHSPTLDILDFDTKVLEVVTARLTAEGLTLAELREHLKQAHSRGIRLLYLTAPSGEPWTVPIIEEAYQNGHFVGGKVTYQVEISNALLTTMRPGTHAGPTAVSGSRVEALRNPSAEIERQLIELSMEAGRCSRFNMDKNLSSDRCRNMFSTWMRNCINHSVADDVLVAFAYEEAPVVEGMVAVRIRGDAMQIVLLAVDPSHRRKGVGMELMRGAYEWAQKHGVAKCTVATQTTNFGARRLYERCGCECAKMEQEFHFWIATAPFNDPVQSDIPNSRPYLGAGELDNIKALFAGRQIQTHCKYGPECQSRLEAELGVKKALLVSSGTAALEMCSVCIGSGPDVEVIMPSYTFVSTANAFVSHGATPVFVDIRPDTQNIDETKIEAAITPRTRAICCVHYAGVPCEMDTIMAIAKEHNLYVVEDNAHGVYSSYKGRMLGSIGDVATLSFHYTKNIVCGEGGALLVNRADLIPTAMIAWEKGTNRFDFLDGKVDKYSWVGKGGSFVLGEPSAAILAAQLEMRPMLISSRLHIWNAYHAALEPLEKRGKLVRPVVPEGCVHNAHIYYIRVPARDDFVRLGAAAKEAKIGVFTHYEPLHSSRGGSLYARYEVDCEESTRCSRSLYRLPIWIGLTDAQIASVLDVIAKALADG